MNRASAFRDDSRDVEISGMIIKLPDHKLYLLNCKHELPEYSQLVYLGVTDTDVVFAYVQVSGKVYLLTTANKVWWAFGPICRSYSEFVDDITYRYLTIRQMRYHSPRGASRQHINKLFEDIQRNIQYLKQELDSSKEVRLLDTNYQLTEDQMETLVKHFAPGEDPKSIPEHIYCEWLDILIDNLA